MKTTAIVFAGGVVAIALTAAYVFHEEEPQPPQAALVQQNAPSAHSPDARVAENVPDQISSGTNPQSQATARRVLAVAYSTATNYREFIREAKSQLESGGGAYAMQAQMDCDYVKNILRDSSSPSAIGQRDSRIIVARAEAKTLLEARCGVLSDAEVGNLVYLQLRKEGKVTQDPLLTLRSQVVEKSSTATPEERARLVNLIIDFQDPLVFSLYSGWLVSANATKSSAYFEGQVWQGKDAEAVIAGVALSPCAFGFECGKRDIIVAVTCLQSGVCEDDRFALARVEAQKGGYSYVKVMDAYGRAVAALQNKDARAFAGGSGT